MFLWTGLCPEIHTAIQNGNDYFTFIACLKAGVKAETSFNFNAEYNKAFKYMLRDKVQDKAEKD
jgi:hypothetical protein